MLAAGKYIIRFPRCQAPSFPFRKSVLLSYRVPRVAARTLGKLNAILHSYTLSLQAG